MKSPDEQYEQYLDDAADRERASERWPWNVVHVPVFVRGTEENGTPVFWLKCLTCCTNVVATGVDEFLTVLSELQVGEPCSTTCQPFEFGVGKESR